MSVETEIPLNALNRSTDLIRGEINSAISRVLDSGWYVLGPENENFEIELASYLGINHVISVGNGTDALEIALATVGVASGDHVITVANAGAYTTVATRLLGATPVFSDIDPLTLLMSPQTLKDALALSPIKPKAIVITHLYGALAPVQELVAIAGEHGIPTIEDCAQSLGASIRNKMGGTFADISTTSFYPTKNLGALGDGGAIFTNNKDFAEIALRMRQYGWQSKYRIEHSRGRNSRLDEMQAAILRAKLPYLDAQNQKRREIHARYELEQNDKFKLVNTSSPSFNGHLAVALSTSRDKDRELLHLAGVKTDIHYPIPDYKQNIPAMKVIPESLEVTDWASSSIYSIPLFPELSETEVERVSAAVATL